MRGTTLAAECPGAVGEGHATIGHSPLLLPEMKKILILALAGSLSMTACAQSSTPAKTEAAGSAIAPAAEPKATPGTPEAVAIAAIRKLNAQVPIEQVDAAPLAGFRQVVVGGQVVYVSDDGRYMLQGTLLDLKTQRDMGQEAMAGLRKRLLAQVPESERIVFAPANPKYTVTVFTDIECGYCRKLHNDIDEYNREGIAVEYLAFPRMGPGTADFAAMESVWCADDRKLALTRAKKGSNPPARQCANPVMAHYQLGQRLGLTGTPLIVAENGLSPPGYLPPKQLRQWLEQNDPR